MEWSPTRDPNEEELELGVQTTEYVACKLYMTEEEKAACTERFEVGDLSFKFSYKLIKKKKTFTLNFLKDLVEEVSNVIIYHQSYYHSNKTMESE